jgi:hypothetical protein
MRLCLIPKDENARLEHRLKAGLPNLFSWQHEHEKSGGYFLESR